MTKEEILTKKVGFISLGCDKNRVDLEKIIFNIKSAGFTIVNDPKLANIIIINTCSFLESSRLESIENIIERKLPLQIRDFFLQYSKNANFRHGYQMVLNYQVSWMKSFLRTF